MKKIVVSIALAYPIYVHALGSFEAGAQKALVCTACHGQQGISVNPKWPNLAGQHANYLIKQLQDIKAGKTRVVPVMIAVMANFNDIDMADLATYYSQQPLAEGKTPIKYLQRGEQLYRGGDFDKKITACIACHGPQATGNAQAGFPLLSAQHAPYTIQQLQAFKAKNRANDLNRIMQDISARMSEEDMEAVAYYIQGLY